MNLAQNATLAQIGSARTVAEVLESRLQGIDRVALGTSSRDDLDDANSNLAKVLESLRAIEAQQEEKLRRQSGPRITTGDGVKAFLNAQNAAHYLSTPRS